MNKFNIIDVNPFIDDIWGEEDQNNNCSCSDWAYVVKIEDYPVANCGKDFACAQTHCAKDRDACIWKVCYDVDGNECSEEKINCYTGELEESCKLHEYWKKRIAEFKLGDIIDEVLSYSNPNNIKEISDFQQRYSKPEFADSLRDISVWVEIKTNNDLSSDEYGDFDFNLDRMHIRIEDVDLSEPEDKAEFNQYFVPLIDYDLVSELLLRGKDTNIEEWSAKDADDDFNEEITFNDLKKSGKEAAKIREATELIERAITGDEEQLYFDACSYLNSKDEDKGYYDFYQNNIREIRNETDEQVIREFFYAVANRLYNFFKDFYTVYDESGKVRAGGLRQGRMVADPKAAKFNDKYKDIGVKIFFDDTANYGGTWVMRVYPAGEYNTLNINATPLEERPGWVRPVDKPFKGEMPVEEAQCKIYKAVTHPDDDMKQLKEAKSLEEDDMTDEEFYEALGAALFAKKYDDGDRTFGCEFGDCEPLEYSEEEFNYEPDEDIIEEVTFEEYCDRLDKARNSR